MFADFAARYEETAAVPHYIQGVYEKYQDRLVYGADMARDLTIYTRTFTIFHTSNEHFYQDYSYHRPSYATTECMKENLPGQRVKNNRAVSIEG